jgi:type IV pilus assembly protein PilM
MSASSPSTIGSWFASPPPPAAVEITARRVNVVAMASHGGTRTITAHASELLPDGLVTPAMNGSNVHDRAALATALKGTIARITPKPRRVALILPDTVAKVSLLRFEKMPKAQELEQLLRWQMRKTVPFRIEEAQLSWVPGVELAGGGREYLALAARRDVIESYERVCDDAGLHAGIVDVASTNLVNAVLATSAGAATGDWLLVHVAPESATMIVVRNARVIFYRNRASDGAALDMGDLVHQTAMYFEDRLEGAAFNRVILAGSSSYGTGADGLRRQIEERVGARVEPLDVRSGVTLRDRIAAGPELLDAIAPAVGVLLRDRPAAALSRGGERVA